MALSVLDEHIASGPGGPATKSYQRERRKALGLPNYRLIRYADDWCLMVSGTWAAVQRLREQAAEALSAMGLRLSLAEKTLITHIDDGLDFLGGASSATPSGAQTGTTSTPIPRARPSRP